MNYKLWNKIDEINNVEAEYFINDLKIREEDGVFLVLDEYENVQAVEIDRIIKSVYKLDNTLSTEQVAQEYIRIKEEERVQAEQEQVKNEELADKISILEAENKALQDSQDIQDRTIIESDMRMMDLEFVIEDLITSISPQNNENIMEVFTMKLFEKGLERSSTYFNQLKQMIERENYDSKEEMERILNKYASGSRPRITQEEYDQLFDMLYPPVYDIITESTEA